MTNILKLQFHNGLWPQLPRWLHKCEGQHTHRGGGKKPEHLSRVWAHANCYTEKLEYILRPVLHRRPWVPALPEGSAGLLIPPGAGLQPVTTHSLQLLHPLTHIFNISESSREFCGHLPTSLQECMIHIVS